LDKESKHNKEMPEDPVEKTTGKIKSKIRQKKQLKNI